MRRLGAMLLVSCICTGAEARAQDSSKMPPLIQIGVEVVEVDELKTRKLGIQWMDTLHVFETEVPALLKIGTLSRNQVQLDIQALMQEGAADLLANPKLVARDGGSATFHAGGEIPYPVAGSLGTVNVEFKPYGVKLKINPRLDEHQWITLTVDAEVSSPDEQNSVTLSGNTVPGIRSRQVTSELTMRPGNTLTLAGLIQNQKQTKTVGIPGLMHIPFLGALFRHQTRSMLRTSVVVFITPVLLESDSILEEIRG